MPLEVSARLPSRSVYLAGETIECGVTFTNILRKKRDGSPAKSNVAKLAWASAQIHCQCSVSEARVQLPYADVLTADQLSAAASNDTSFVPFKGERGVTVMSTKPIILFCDLTLQPGETKTVKFQETIPVDAPPSFRGSSVKYSYKLTIGTQRFDCPTKLLRVPLRCLLIPGLNDLTVYDEEPGDTKPSNPFSLLQKPSHSLLDVAMEVLQTMTCRKGTNSFNITNSQGKVARFCLFKQAYRIGDDIVGTFDFTMSTVPCVQFSVTLQSEEHIAEACKKKGSTHPGTVTSYSKHHEFCLHTAKTHISVPVPLTATPGFNTDIVSLRWRLHFEFVTCRSPLPLVPEPQTEQDCATWQGPAELSTETMVWDLPIRVFATNPVHAATVSLLKLENSVRL